MGKRLKGWKQELKKHKNLILLSVIFLIIANTLNYLAGMYAETKGDSAVSDLILDHIPAIDLGFLFIYGFSFIIIVLFFYPLLYKVRELHVAISQFSLLVMIRSFFVSLTHLKMPVGAILSTDAPRLYALLDFQNALFFSGHTAVPFLGFLLFRKEKIGIFFLIATIVMALTVLFMHVHYSIDVFAALFIAYGSYKIGNWLFKRVNN
ncbi:MAG: hypothetical protein ABH840_01810 [Nanoarchaeota archaeon]